MSTQAHWFSLSALTIRKPRSVSKTVLGTGASSTFDVFVRWLNPFSARLIALALLIQHRTFPFLVPAPLVNLAFSQTCLLAELSDRFFAPVGVLVKPSLQVTQLVA